MALDVFEGLRRHDLWMLLGWQDIRVRYKRSLLGPFWLTLSMGVMVAGIGFLYAALFRVDVHEFLPRLAIGFTVWTFISSSINEGTQSLIRARAMITQTTIPVSVSIYRVIWNHFVVFLHNAVIIAAVMAIFRIPLTLQTLLAIPGLFVLTLNLVWMAMIAAVIGTRYRDVHPIIQSLMRFAFYMTPVIWDPSLIPTEYEWVLFLNPFFHLIELVRSPLVGNEAFFQMTWAFAACAVLVGSLVATAIFTRCLRRIPFWV